MPQNVRAPLLLLAISASFYFLPWFQALALLLAVAITCLIVVFLRQNLELFRHTSLGELARVTLRTLLIWSPILLFYLPQHFLNREINRLMTEKAYAAGIVHAYGITEQTSPYEFDRQLRSGALLPDIPDSTRQRLIRALIYAEANSDTLREPQTALPAFRYAFTTLYPGPALSPAARSALDSASLALDLVVRRQDLAGENEFQLNTELTIQDMFRERESAMTDVLDSVDRQISSEVQQTLDSIEQNLSSTSESAKEDLALARRGVEAGTDRQLDDLENGTVTAFETAFPPRLTDISARFGRADCGIPGVGCRALNGFKGLLRGVYAEERPVGLRKVRQFAAERKAAARQQIRAKLDEVQDSAYARIDRGEDGVRMYKDSIRTISRISSETVADTKAGLHELRLALNIGVRDGIWALQRYLYYLRLLSLAIFLFLVVTSFIYVFSRVAFAGDTSLYMTLRRKNEPRGSSKLVAHGTGYTIPVGHMRTFYVSKRYVPTGRAPKLAIPLPSVSILRRLLTGTYFMNAITTDPRYTEPVDFRSTAGAEFVEWQLGAEEEVVFDYHQLVAFTADVRLRSHLSLRLTTLLLGRPFFPLARGPGKLVLITKGEPILSGSAAGTRSVSAERILSWQRPALFSVQSETGMIDIYFSGLYLQRSSEELVLIDADDGNTKQKTGLLRFVLRFLLPI